jgi:hypothetical protein
VAYVETEYFGGEGTQAATVWDRGATIFGPAEAEAGPINQALRRLGVERTAGEDEFDKVGLGRHRRNEDWIKGSAGAGPASGTRR